MNIYVGNVSYSVTEEDLRQAFEGFGQVTSVSIIKDKFSGQSKGFGFVEMPVKEEAQAAIGALNGKELKGRTLNVNEARPRTGVACRPAVEHDVRLVARRLGLGRRLGKEQGHLLARCGAHAGHGGAGVARRGEDNLPHAEPGRERRHQKRRPVLQRAGRVETVVLDVQVVQSYL